MEGIPLETIEGFDSSKNNLIIIDDLMLESSKSKHVVNLFTKGFHHRNISVIFIMQNFFYGAKEIRTITLNAHYIILFKNPRDKTQITSLARQMFPSNSQFLQESFAEATREPFSFLLIDLKPFTPEELRIRTNIFSTDKQ